ncbi:MAG: hypothetical protein AAF351_16135 [Pseudomonadota bacterium]
MIVTDHFVYIHTSRTGGTFLNRLIMNQVPGARMIQYHGCLRDLPAQFAELPVIGFVRNPYDWYVSMFYDYRRKQQYVFQVLSDMGERDFDDTVTRFLNLGDGSDDSQSLLQRLAAAAPREIRRQKPGRRELPGLIARDFEQYTDNIGYFSWLFRRMYATDRSHDVRIGRFENLRDEARRLFEETGTPVTARIDAYLNQAQPMNSSPRPTDTVYSDALAGLIAERDSELIKTYGYAR